MKKKVIALLLATTMVTAVLSGCGDSDKEKSEANQESSKVSEDKSEESKTESQAEESEEKVLEYADLKGTEIVIDAYCGVGTIGMVLSKKAKEVYGVELNKQSVINARSNAYDNKIKNIKFVCADATEYLHDLAKENVQIDVLIMDPPRSGSTEKFLNAISKLNPKKIVYVSCDASTLARDLSYLLKVNKNYEIRKKCIVDMFVGTYHVETITLLCLKEPKK